MKELLHVLLVEDDESDAALVKRHLALSGFQAEIVHVQNEPDFLRALARTPNVILSDFALPRFSGPRALELATALVPDVPFLIVSGTVGEDAAVQLMKAGARDIVQKEKLTRLGPAVVHALNEARRVVERKQAEKVLAESEARYRSLFEHASDGIFIVTSQGECIEANPRAAEIFGLPLERLVGAYLQDLMDRERRRRLEGELERLLHGQAAMSEWRIARGDGSTAHVEVSARLIESGKVLAIVRDQTERRRAKARLHEEQERFRTVASMAPGVLHSIHMTDAGKVKLLYVSPRVRDVFGLEPEVIERDAERVLDQWHPDDKKRVLRSIYASRASLTPWHVEYRVLHPEKGVVWVEGRSMPVPEPDGGVTWHGVLTDITDRKRAEAVHEERHQIEERLARLADSAPGVMAVMRQLQGGKLGLDYASRRLDDVLGFQHTELEHDLTPVFDRVHPEDRPRLMARIESSARTLEPHVTAFRYKHPEKCEVWIEVRSSPMREEGGSTVWHSFLIDVTERVALEEQLRQSQKMEAFGQLASGVAHDFNNILTIIQGNASMLADSDPSEQTSIVEEIVHASKRASSLTRQLLVFSRRQPMKSIDLDLSDVMARMAKMLKPILGEDIALSTSLPRELAVVHADPGMMEQIVLNLAVNARDAMPRGGKLAITTDLVHFEQEPPQNPDVRPGNYVRLTVADTGPGISPEIRSRIFEPFFTTKEVGKGTGLGLATVHGIVKQHQGFIDVDSRPGEGAVFHVYLPAAHRHTSSVAPKPESTDMPGGRETILVVEDELSVRTFVTRVLKRCGYSVVTAPSGVAALRVWDQRKARIDLLLTDMVMPDGMTGRELAERLSSESEELKVMYTSGFSADWAEKGVTLTEGVNFLQKPYEPHKLAQAVRAILDRGKTSP